MKKNNIGKTLVLGIFIYMIWVLGNGLLQLYKARGRLDQAKTELSLEQARNEELKRKYDEVQDPTFIEKEAREKLNMQKQGESVVILPKMDVKSENGSAEKQSAEANWEKWLGLFR